MPAVQTTYAAMTAARVGQIADMEDLTNAISRSCETVAGIAMGSAVQRGALAATCKAVGDGGATKFYGVAVRTQSRDANTPDLYQRYEDVSILTKGVIWVTVNATVVQGDAAYYTTGGAFTSVVGTNTAIPNAVFDTSAASGGLAILRLA